MGGRKVVEAQYEKGMRRSRSLILLQRIQDVDGVNSLQFERIAKKQFPLYTKIVVKINQTIIEEHLKEKEAELTTGLVNNKTKKKGKIKERKTERKKGRTMERKEAERKKER